MRIELLLLLVAACNGEIEKENVATTSDAGSPSGNDGGGATLDATTIDGGAPGFDGGGVDASAGACGKNEDCNGGTCFEGLCMCGAPKYVQPDGKCGDAAPSGCTEVAGTCRQNPASCMAGELETHFETSMSCGDLVPAVCCVPAASCKTTVDLVCCGASTTAYEPTCVNGWRTCAGGGPTPRLRSQGCP